MLANGISNRGAHDLSGTRLSHQRKYELNQPTRQKQTSLSRRKMSAYEPKS